MCLMTDNNCMLFCIICGNVTKNTSRSTLDILRITLKITYRNKTVFILHYLMSFKQLYYL